MPPNSCRHCGKTNLPEKRFCVECGRRLELACATCAQPIAAGEKFCGNCGSQVDAGERRHLSVLFADLVDSTQMAARLDPEEYHLIVQTYHDAVARVVARFDGYVAQYQGDGIVAYFGWPIAHGNDAERAVRSGLEIIEAIKAINRGLAEGSQIAVRAGIDTGQVVVGHLGGGERREITAIGETPNTAARVQGATPPGSLAITAATSRLVAGLFAIESLGPHNFKGISHPVEIFRVQRASGMRSRLQAAQTAKTSCGDSVKLGIAPRLVKDRSY